MGRIFDAARRNPPKHASDRDRLDGLEEAVAEATGRTVEDLHAEARQRAEQRRERRDR